MNLDEIYRQLHAIEAVKHDYEVAHGLEDDLYMNFVKHVAIGLSTVAELAVMAEAVLESRDIEFARHCA